MITKAKLKNQIREAIYAGKVGIHELMVFYGFAEQSVIDKVDEMFKADNADLAWHTVKDYLQSHGKLVTLVAEAKLKRKIK